jgi:uncharacterized protein involved in response to NO
MTSGRAHEDSQEAPREPYRVFFPLGIAIGVAGVAIWPLYYFSITSSYSGRAHAFIQIEGFIYSFVAGFLLTAVPRFTRTQVPGRPIQLVVAALILASAVAFDLLSERVGHLAFLAVHAILVALVAHRFVRRKSPPPDTFALVGTGLLAGGVGTVLNAGIAWQLFSPALEVLGKRLLTEGMVLSLVLGVGGFLGPRLLGFAELPNFQQIGSPQHEPTRSRLPRNRHVVFAAAGLGILASVIAEYGFDWQGMALLRAVVASAVIGATVRPWRFPVTRTTLAWCVWTAVLLLTAGLWVAALVPTYRVDALHIVFLGGFTLLILAVGTRVALSHGGHSLAAEKRSWVLRFGASTVLIAMLARIGAPFAPDTYFAHLATAAILWIAGLCAWGYYLIRLLARSGSESARGSRS